MKTRELGKTGVMVSAIGLGGMPLSIEGRPSERDGIRVIHRALELGVTLMDTADSYCIDENDKHHNERLIHKALQTYSGETSQVIVATKGGLMRPDGRWEVNGDPKHTAKTIRESYRALGGDRPIPLWQLHAVDDKFPLEETLKAVRDAVDEGLIRFVGLSNVSVEEIKKSLRIVQVISVQNRYNPWDRNPERDGVLEFCEKEKITFLPWSPVGGGWKHGQIASIPILQELARAKNVSPYRVVLAWLLAKSPCVLPIPGASRVASIEDSVLAVDVSLSADEIKRLGAGFPDQL